MRKKDLLNFNVSIYALFNPFTNMPFYVGATRFALTSRLSGHIIGSRTLGPPGVEREKRKMIRKIIKKKSKPEIVQLEVVDFALASKTEEFYYDLFTFYGFKLFQTKWHFNYTETLAGKLISNWELGFYKKNYGFTIQLDTDTKNLVKTMAANNLRTISAEIVDIIEKAKTDDNSKLDKKIV